MKKQKAHPGVVHLRKIDPKLATLIKKVGPFTLAPEHAQEPLHALTRSIVYQQLSGKAAAAILNKVKNLFKHQSFPSAEEILNTSEEAFRSAGLSKSKTAAIKDLAQKSLEGVVPSAQELHQMTDQEIIERLIQVRGIGRWTVEMMLIFKLGRMDVFPASDYGVRKGYSLVFNKRKLLTPKDLQKQAEKWKPFRTVAAWYLWRALD